MSTVRVLWHGETRDVEGHAALVKRMHAFIEQYEPETLVWECFADQLTGQVVWHEVYASGDAFLFHLRNLDEQDFFGEFVRLVRMTSVTSLEPVTDDRVWTELRSFNAAFLHEAAAVHR